MKQFWTVFIMIFALGLSAAPAEAKRFGGKSFGKSHHVQPKKAPQKRDAAPADKSNNANNAAPSAAPAGKGGMMGGMLGGLAAGGLLGYMMGNGAFEGIEFIDILLIGLAIFVILRLLRGRAAKTSAAQSPMQRAAFEMPNSGGANSANPAGNTETAREPLFNEIGGFGATNVPLNLPEGFDVTAFLMGAREHYRALQEAWNANDFSTIESYVSPALHHNLALERADLTTAPQTEVLFVDAELVRADYSATLAEISLKFSGRYRDAQEGVEEEIADIWHLERDLTQENRPWLIVGIEA